MGVTGLGMKRAQMSQHRVPAVLHPRRCTSFSLDSGAHSLYTAEVIAKGLLDVTKKHRYGYYRSPEFKEYCRQYADFVRMYGGIDWYVTVDVIFEPQLSWEILKYLENELGLNPMPVVHYGAEMKWIDKHVEAGYEYLGIGGLGQEVNSRMYKAWGDTLFDHLCGGGKHGPVVRTHGFAMTAFPLIIRYPFFSVDSASWAKLSGFGVIWIPHKRGGRFTFEDNPYAIGFSSRSEARKVRGRHYSNLMPGEQKVVREWLDEIGIPVGSMKVVDGKEVPDEFGVFSQYNARAAANIKYLEKLCEWLPPYPWVFKAKPKRGFF